MESILKKITPTDGHYGTKSLLMQEFRLQKSRSIAEMTKHTESLRYRESKPRLDSSVDSLSTPARHKLLSSEEIKQQLLLESATAPVSHKVSFLNSRKSSYEKEQFDQKASAKARSYKNSSEGSTSADKRFKKLAS